MGADRWLTLSAVPEEQRRVVVTIPDGPDWLAVLRGAVLLLCMPWNWEEHGDLTPDDMAVEFTRAYDTLQWDSGTGGATLPIGSVLHYAGAVVPDVYLVCDGTEYLISEYPDLYAVIGATFGQDTPEVFRVPNLVDRFVFGSDVSMGYAGGAATHTLSSAEMPAHSHQLQRSTGAGSSVYLTQGSNLATLVDINQYTKPAGSGAAHNNMPPYMTLLPVIVARVP